MKNFTTFFTALLTLILVSCNEDADDFETLDLSGTWERMHFNEDVDLNYVNTYQFNQNGTFERRGTYRNPGSSEDLGFSSYSEGVFSLQENMLHLQQTKFLGIEEKMYGDFEELEEIEVDSSAEVMVTIQNDNTEMVFDYGPCNDMASCIGTLTYQRVW